MGQDQARGTRGVRLVRLCGARRPLPRLLPDARGGPVYLNALRGFSALARALTRDIELHGTVMEQGRKLLLLFGSANRDERFWDRPNQLDVTRHPAGPLAFRHGLHHCLGAALARLETGVAPEELLPTLGEYTVDHAGCERVHSANVLGCSRLPVVCA